MADQTAGSGRSDRGYDHLSERSGHSGGPELGRPRPLAPHLRPRHRLELPAVDPAQLDHHQLRGQRHLPPVVQPGGGRRPSRRADHELELPGRRVVYRRDEDQGQRRPRCPLHPAAEQIHLHERSDPGTQQNRPGARSEGGNRLRAQRRSAYQGGAEQRRAAGLPADLPFSHSGQQGNALAAGSSRRRIAT